MRARGDGRLDQFAGQTHEASVTVDASAAVREEIEGIVLLDEDARFLQHPQGLCVDGLKVACRKDRETYPSLHAALVDGDVASRHDNLLAWLTLKECTRS